MSGRFMLFRKLAIMLIFVLLLSSMIIVAYAQAGQGYLVETDNAYVDSSYPDSNYGGLSPNRDYLQIENYQYTILSQTYKDEKIVWLKFNFSSMPDGAVVDSATLNLFLDYSISPDSYDVHAYSCSDDSWNESSLTYSNMPIYNTISMNSTLVSSMGWYSWNVVDAVRDALNRNATAVTIVLFDPSSHSSNTTVMFQSEEAGISSLSSGPHLFIDWSSIVPEFPTFLILPFFTVTILIAVAFYKKKAMPYRRL